MTGLNPYCLQIDSVILRPTPGTLERSQWVAQMDSTRQRPATLRPKYQGTVKGIAAARGKHDGSRFNPRDRGLLLINQDFKVLGANLQISTRTRRESVAVAGLDQKRRGCQLRGLLRLRTSRCARAAASI